jgi:hypothetical protein
MYTIDAQTVNAIIFAFLGLIGGFSAILGAIAMSMRSRSASDSHEKQVKADGALIAEKARAEVATLQEKSSNEAVLAVVEIAKQGVFIQQQLLDAVREYTRVNGEHSAQMRGMVTMMDDFARVLKNVVIGMDDVTGHIPSMATDIKAIAGVTATLETNIDATVSEQFGPVVLELKIIGGQITDLIREVQAKDGQINARLTELIIKFQEAEGRVMRTLEPVVLQHIGEFVANGNLAIKPPPTFIDEKDKKHETPVSD